MRKNSKETRETVPPLPAASKEPVAENSEDLRGRIAALAYSYWEVRGCPDGSAEEDWYRAEAELTVEVARKPSRPGDATTSDSAGAAAA